MSEITSLKTADYDPRFVNQNKTKQCWAYYIEFHRCVNELGADHPKCLKPKQGMVSICPTQWIEDWDTLRAEGRFPGPL